MAQSPMTPELLELVAERFKALAEPARLRILNALREREMTVSDIMEATGLQMLASLGFVGRRKEGLYAFYRLADEDVFQLCDLMCGRLAREAQQRERVLSGE
jgi:DNA-binding transcriptional ArsR family regulator